MASYTLSMAKELFDDSDVDNNAMNNRLTRLEITLLKLESRLRGGTYEGKLNKIIKVSHPLVPEDEIQKIISLIQSYADDIQLIGEADPITFSKMKWRILTEINDRLVSNPATTPKTYKTTILAIMSTLNNIRNVTQTSKDLLSASFGNVDIDKEGKPLI